MLKNLTLLTYTHSNCSDSHQMYFDSINHFMKEIKHFVLTDKNIGVNNISEIIYDDNTKYSEQMVLGLSKIETDYLIYSQEDYILYDEIDIESLKKCMDLLDNNEEIMFIRLICSGLSGFEKDYNEEFLVIDTNNKYFFSTQITVWRKEILKKMFELSKTRSIRDEINNSVHLSSLGGIGICSKSKGTRIGNHHNSVIYPYIATAIVGGKWNLSQYGNILEPLLDRYNIDKNKRGYI